MRALTVTQPWATLVASGAKRIETRSWRTHHRGPIYIHAAKALPGNWRPFADRAFVDELEPLVGLNEHGCPNIDRLPTGVLLAVATLDAIVPTVEDRVLSAEVAARLILSPAERMFGDYTAGRFAWLLRDVVPLLEPVPATGMLGLWELDPALLARCILAPSIRLDSGGGVV